MDSTRDDDDARSVELETLAAIWPELRRGAAFSFELELPVRPARPLTVLFGAPGDPLLVSHLPALRLRLTLPDGYPGQRPPQAAVSTSPPWLPRATLAALEEEAARLWREAGRDLVAYAYIDHVQRAADVFGAVTPDGTLRVDPRHRLAVLDHDTKAKRAAFGRESFECGVCLGKSRRPPPGGRGGGAISRADGRTAASPDPKKGSSCHSMADCGHVFCLGCLRDFYGDAIEQGSIATVRCLAPDCANQRAGARPLLRPGELLQIDLSGDAVRRYVTLRYRTELEADKDTVYCPRWWCGGAARSERHKKPEGLELAETSDDGSEQDDDADDDQPAVKTRQEQLLCVCEDCGFAFCGRCLQTWHGEFVWCAPRRDADELGEEEKASLEYLQLHTSPCPTCSAPAQRRTGATTWCARSATHNSATCAAPGSTPPTPTSTTTSSPAAASRPATCACGSSRAATATTSASASTAATSRRAKAKTKTTRPASDSAATAQPATGRRAKTTATTGASGDGRLGPAKPSPWPGKPPWSSASWTTTNPAGEPAHQNQRHRHHRGGGGAAGRGGAGPRRGRGQNPRARQRRRRRQKVAGGGRRRRGA